jgi:glyoxylase-like metal-dependent hydrolase (beta-lactamase superfamily II)
MKLSENIYLLEASAGSYVYLIKGEETVLIDTGLPFRRKGIVGEIKTLCPDPTEIRHILITHSDIDHIGNAYALQQLTGAKIWASAEDIPVITGEKDRSSFKKYLKYLFPLKAPESMEPYRPGENICGVEVIPTPGHTPGHVCLRYRDILFAGDLLESKDGSLRPYPAPWNWNDRMMAESAGKIAELSVQWICPAHGKPVAGNYRT